MRVEKLGKDRLKDFVDYCRRYREELSDEYIEDTDLEDFYPDEENPTYILLNDEDDILGAVSLINNSYRKRDKIGLFRIFYSNVPEKEAYELMLDKIIKHAEELNSIYLYIKEEDKKRAEILEMLSFKKDSCLYCMTRDSTEIIEPRFPNGFQLRTYQYGVDDEAWCDVRNTCFPEEEPKTPENINTYWEENPDLYLKGGMLLLYHNDKPAAAIRSSKVIDDNSEYNYISVVCVKPEYRRMGLAQNMLRAALEFGKSKGYEKAMLEVVPENEKALNLYIKEGFKKMDASVAYIYQL